MATQESQELKLLFTVFDVDHSGTLTKEELKQLLQSPDPDGPSVSEEQVTEYLKLADTDNSGDISLDEFVTFINDNVPQGAYGLKSIFRTIDTSGDGFVEKDEFEQVKKTSQNLNQNLINIFDKKFQKDTVSKITYEHLSGDGCVDKQEFEQVMKEKGKDLNQDQIKIFNKKFQQDENSKVTYEQFIDGAMEIYKNIKFN
ncbi:unnamed protein product [Rotaria sp. Silwood2]|nr:unnamed protein product [Rotaria sp. Silwood2]CAF4057595.1 unnamed protein product [Rotaria sp. Silwood2]